MVNIVFLLSVAVKWRMMFHPIIYNPDFVITCERNKNITPSTNEVITVNDLKRAYADNPGHDAF